MSEEHRWRDRCGRLEAELAELRRKREAEAGRPGRSEMRLHLDALVRLTTQPEYRELPRIRAIQATLELAAEVLGTDRSSAWLLDPTGARLECVDLYERRAARHNTAPALSAVDYPAYFDAVLTQRAVDAVDAVADPRTAEFSETYLRPLGIVSMLDAAIRRLGNTLGVVCFEQVGTEREWSIDEVSFAGQVADHVARILVEEERAELEAQLRQAMKMEAVGRLAGGIAHDFNNLLTAIGVNVELAQLEIPAGSPVLPRLEEALRATESAAALTRQLLAFSRRQIVEPRALDPRALVRDIASMLRRLIGEDVHLELCFTEDPGLVLVDPAQLEQALVNLAVNARDAMPMGGRLTIETAPVEVSEDRVRSHARGQPGPHVRLRVTDTGHGMPEEVQAHLFEPFFTTKPPGRGTGLGLSTIFGIVQQAGGFIEVTSRLGEGSTFDLFLPRLEGVGVAVVSERDDANLPRGDETVLLVEDDPQVAAVACALLERLGYGVLSARTGEEAFALAEGHSGPIHLVLTDVVLPGLSGRVLAERLTGLLPGLRVLYTSGYTDDVVIRHGISEERLEFLAKPYSLRALATKVRQVLQR